MGEGSSRGEVGERWEKNKDGKLWSGSKIDMFFKQFEKALK